MAYGSDYANNVSQILLHSGDAAAQARLKSGEAWSGALGQIGQQIAAIPQQLQQAKAQQQEGQLRTAQIADVTAQTDERERATQRAKQYADTLKALIPQYSKPGAHGTLETDDQAIATGLARAGFGPESQKWLSDSAATREKYAQITKVQDEHQAFTEQTRDKQLDLLADIARGVKSPLDFVSAVAHGVTHGGLDPQQAQAYVDQATSAPDAWEQLRNNIINQAPSTRKEQATQRGEMMKPVAVPEGGSLVVPGGNPSGGPQVIATGAPKPQTPEQDDNRYRTIVSAKTLGKAITPEDQAWAKAYEQQKTLGVDKTAAAATVRQAIATEAANARLDRSQRFTESQAGRSELTNKVEQPYLDALEKASTLKTVIEAAKSGNMAAGSVTPLLATLGLVTMEGVKRINTTELNQVQGAGSLVERLKGKLLGYKEGQPLSPKLQEDVQQLSDLLMKSARQKYEQGFNTTTKRYGLSDEKMLGDVTGAKTADPLGIRKGG